MSTRLSPIPAVVSVLLCAAVVFGCAAQVKVTPVAERTYALECREPLANCLVRAHEMCSEHGYDVLTATERRETSGASPVEGEFLHSLATVRCRQAVPLFGTDPNPPLAAVAGTPAPSASVPASPPLASPTPPSSSPPGPAAAPGSAAVPAPNTAPTSAPTPAPPAAPTPTLPNPNPLHP